MADLIDPTVAGKYPVILGEGLLGKGSGSNEVFTSIRYNHKPELSSEDAPSQAKLKPTTPGKTTSYDLTYTDGDSYAFRGVRNTGDDQYVLYFDPERKAFVLDKVDSSFDMNVTRLPGNSNPDDLARQFPHLGLSSSSSSLAKPAPAAKAPVSKPVKKAKEPTVMAMPTASKPKPKKTDDDEDDEDDDGGLLIEYPDAPPATKKADFSPAFPTQRRFDDYMDQRESEADDADGESDDEPDMDFKLPSPVNKAAEPAEAEAEAEAEEEEDDDDAIDLEADLEKEMEIAFEDLANSQEEARGGDESEISEED